MKQIQEWLGHSNFATTADVYSHLDYSSKVMSASAIAEALAPRKSREKEQDTREMTSEERDEKWLNRLYDKARSAGFDSIDEYMEYTRRKESQSGFEM